MLFSARSLLTTPFKSLSKKQRYPFPSICLTENKMLSIEAVISSETLCTCLKVSYAVIESKVFVTRNPKY